MAYVILFIILVMPVIVPVAAIFALFVFFGARKPVALLMVFLIIPIAVGAFALWDLTYVPFSNTIVSAFILLQLVVFAYFKKRELSESLTEEQEEIRERAVKLVQEEMQARRKKIFCVLIVLFMISVIRDLDPLRRSPEYIREYVLRHTPIGMPIDEVEGVINRRIRWGRIGGMVTEMGFPIDMINPDYSPRVGEKKY